MKRSNFWVRAGVLLCLGVTLSWAAPQEVVEVENIEYLQGVPGHPKKKRGFLGIAPSQIVFLTKRKVQFTIEGDAVVYVAARAQASMRTRTADIGVATASIVGVVIPGAYPLVLLFHKAEKHLLSIEYLEGENGIRRLALFNVRDHSARAVKKMIDTRLGLTPDYYRNKDREEEERKRKMERQKAPVGYWEATKNTMAGDSQYARVLLEESTYAVLIFDRYVGFKPDDMDWAKYRIPIRRVKSDRPATETLIPLYKSSRLVGFKFDGKTYLFY